MENAKPIKVKAKLFWANLAKPNEMSGKYQVDLGGLSKAAVEALETLGLDVRTKNDDRGFFITCKSQHPIKAYDKDGTEITDKLIGNDSEAVAVIGAYAWQFKNKKGTSASLKKLTITNLVEFVANVDGDEETTAKGAAEIEEDVIL
jgi:hypothetical protein